MEFDKDNNIIKLCVEGMELEWRGQANEAGKIFQRAWNEAVNHFEKFTAAHYVARHQKSIGEKLKWDKISLELALKIDYPNVQSTLASLYLNIAKGYEDLNDIIYAKENYKFALSSAAFLPDNGYGNLIRGGIKSGLERMAILELPSGA